MWSLFLVLCSLNHTKKSKEVLFAERGDCKASKAAYRSHHAVVIAIVVVIVTEEAPHPNQSGKIDL